MSNENQDNEKQLNNEETVIENPELRSESKFEDKEEQPSPNTEPVPIPPPAQLKAGMGSAFKVKPVIPVGKVMTAAQVLHTLKDVNPAISEVQVSSPPPKKEKEEVLFTAEQVKKIAEDIEARLRTEIQNGSLKAGATQVLPKDKAKVSDIDWTKLTIDDIYDLSIPIEAKAFGSADALKVDLVDKSYEARWVNTNPMRLGKFLAWGFTYVEPKDLQENLATEVVKDAQDHFVIQDVVLMKIQKPKYFAALRAAHERAINTVKSVQASKTAANIANQFMEKEVGSQYLEAAAANKVDFYNPGIEI